MIGNLNKKRIVSLLCVSLFISCGNIETEKGDGLFENDSGRYTVVEVKSPASSFRSFDKTNTEFHHTYYLLDTKTGEIKKINWSEIE
ncbi:MAG: hypothetical protein HOG85_03360 [Flavobacteriales bacterium]|nr:hypothetical protein [Flavobacteriales bacterium]